MQEKYFPANQLQPIENTQSFIPLAHGQRALWHLYQMAPKSTALNIYCTVEFSSDLNLTSWHRAWQKIGKRHSILRTTYTSREGQPVQVVDPHREVQLDVIDASNWSEDYLKTQILATADCPFDLEKGSVLRVQLYTRQDKPSVQVLVMHQIAGDMWSFDILLEELQLLYAKEMEVLEGDSAKGNNVINKVDPLPWQYTDYVIWQQKTLESAKGKQLRAYWKQELAGELPVLNLPTDRRRPPVQTYEGNSQFIELDEALLEKLRDVGKCEGASLYTLLLAAFLVQLYRYTNQEDILVGSAMAGRSAHQEFKKIVGYFSDPVVLRANLSGSPTFKEFLAQIRGTVFRALRHQDYPFPLLVEQLDANRDLSRPPLFQVAFTWQKHRWYETASNFSSKQGKYLSMKPYSSGLQRGSVLDLNLQIEEAGSSLVANWQYNTDLFDAATISRMAGHFQTLLEAIVANPEQCVAQLPLLTEAERHQLLVEWNNTRTEYPQDKCIHQLFEEQVERTPDNVAVVFEDQKLTYRELNAKANQLAHYLQKLGVGPEILVGICVERSLEMVIGILSILKAGGAYVPLDPTYPKERFALMLEDTQLSLLLSQEHLLKDLAEYQTQVICIDTNWNLITQESAYNLPSGIIHDNLIAVFFTSGSTGKPKGIMINRISYLALCLWYIKFYKITSEAKVLLLYSFSFDSSFKNIISPLLTGGTLFLIDFFTPLKILTTINNQKITIINTTTSVFKIMIDFLNPGKEYESLSSLKEVAFGGEPLVLTKQIKLWINSQYCSCRLTNLYGTAESSDLSTVYEINQKNIITLDKVPIGKPIKNNVKIYILDKNNNLQPIGLTGELCVSNIGGLLGRGYLNKPVLTAQKFVSNPWIPGEKLYKTGDLAKWLPDGNLECFGRIDHQVKLHGFRIELEEIEAVIRQHPAVREAVVIIREDVMNGKCLVAYLLTNQQATFSMGELRSFLNKKLPIIMVPSIFVILENFPLNPNGKIDRNSLPKPDTARNQFENTYIAPCSCLEKIIVKIWEEVLNLKRVGIQDNFFELGGQSLMAIQVVSRFYNTLRIQIPLSYIFQFPTVSHLATAISFQNSKVEKIAQYFLSIASLPEQDVK